MKVALVLMVAVIVLSVAATNGTADQVSIEVPSEITGFFVGLSYSIFEVFKQLVKALLLAVANML